MIFLFTRNLLINTYLKKIDFLYYLTYILTIFIHKSPNKSFDKSSAIMKKNPTDQDNTDRSLLVLIVVAKIIIIAVGVTFILKFTIQLCWITVTIIILLLIVSIKIFCMQFVYKSYCATITVMIVTLAVIGFTSITIKQIDPLCKKTSMLNNDTYCTNFISLLNNTNLILNGNNINLTNLILNDNNVNLTNFLNSTNLIKLLKCNNLISLSEATKLINLLNVFNLTSLLNDTNLMSLLNNTN